MNIYSLSGRSGLCIRDKISEGSLTALNKWSADGSGQYCLSIASLSFWDHLHLSRVCSNQTKTEVSGPQFVGCQIKGRGRLGSGRGAGAGAAVAGVTGAGTGIAGATGTGTGNAE